MTQNVRQSTNDVRFGHDCRRIAHGFVYLVHRLPRIDESVRNQLSCVSLSMLTNIAEGADRREDDDRNEARRFFSIARERACECEALLDRIDDVPPRLAALLSSVIASLVHLAK